jgi:ABC-type tungstate transport system permease subunit
MLENILLEKMDPLESGTTKHEERIWVQATAESAGQEAGHMQQGSDMQDRGEQWARQQEAAEMVSSGARG